MSAGVQKKDHQITVKVSAEQLRLIDQRAKKCGVRMSVWMREILLQAATRQASVGYLRIKEPDGATT